MDKKKKTSTRAWRAQAALGGLVRDKETWIKDEELRVLGHCFLFSSHWIALHLITEFE